MKLENRVAIVTGSGGGIGRAYAHALAKEGAAVVIAEIVEQNGKRVAQEIVTAGGKAAFVPVDVSNEKSTLEMARKAAELFGGIDILVNNAAIFGDMKPWDILTGPMEYWKHFFSVNMDGVLLCSRAVAPYMRQRGKGKIVNQSSRASYEVGSGGTYPHYSLSKLTVNGLTAALAKHLGQWKINVNAIAPGGVETEGGLRIAPANTRDARAALTALKRGGKPEDLCPLLLFLASEDSDWMTGQVVIIDGGQVMRM